MVQAKVLVEALDASRSERKHIAVAINASRGALEE
jgi:hypothetical protein